jgi:hypothetical protein
MAVTQEEIEREIASLRDQVGELERRQRHWPQLANVCRVLAIFLAVAALGCAAAGATLTYLGRPNPMLAVALSFVLTSLSVGLLGQALRSAP